MSDATLVAEAALRELGAPSQWRTPRGYPDSLALCVIDSVFSLRSRYRSVENALDSYRAVRGALGADADRDGAPQLVDAILRAGGPENASVVLFANQSRAPGTRRLKAAAIMDGAQGLIDTGVRTTADLRRALGASRADVRSRWLSVPGLGPISWDYLAMLAGEDGVKADTWVVRHVTRVAGEPVSASRAAEALIGAAEILGVSTKTLDHRIWLYESGRDS